MPAPRIAAPLEPRATASGAEATRLVVDSIRTAPRAARTVVGTALVLSGSGVALAAPTALAAGDTATAIVVAICGLVGFVLGILMGAGSSARRGRRRYALDGLALVVAGFGLLLVPGLAGPAALIAGIGAALSVIAAGSWLADVAPAGLAAPVAPLAVIAGVVVGATQPLALTAPLILVGALGALLAAETVPTRQTPVFVLPAAPDFRGRPGAALAAAVALAAIPVLWLGLLPGGIVAGALLVVATATVVTVGRPIRGTAIAEPGTKAYVAAVKTFDASARLTPAAAVTVTTVDEVREAIVHARARGLGVSMHSTGHAGMGHDDLARQLLLRVKMAGDIEVDADRALVRIPAGAAWGDVVPLLTPLGLAVPHGTSGHVGVVGYLTRGGLSGYGRTTGVAANHLESIELVTADGELVTASREREPELFWALRGGGGGFGVVTSVTVRTFRTGEVVTGTTAWELEDAPAVADAWAHWTAAAGSGITTSLRVLDIPPLPGMPLGLTRRPLLVIDGTAVDDAVPARDSVAGLLGPLRGIARPVLDTWRAAGADEVPATHMDPPFSPAHASAHALLGAGDWRDEEQATNVVGAFIEATARRGTAIGIAELRQLGGRLAEPASDGGAVSHYRGAFGWMAISLHGRRGPDAAAAAVDDLQSAMSIWRTGYTVPTLASERERPARSFPIGIAERAERERRRIDPAGVFRADVAAGALVR